MMNRLSTMDKRLRLMLIATALLILLGTGQMLIIFERNHGTDTAMLGFTFSFVSLFFIPTSLILSAVVAHLVRSTWREHKPMMMLAGLNVILALQLVWFAIHPCSWATIFGLHLAGC